MKKPFFAILFFAVFTSTNYSHPLKEISISFDHKTKILTVIIEHEVKYDTNKHFINDVEIELNGKEIIEQKCFSQSEGNYQVLTYTIIDAKMGDKISVKAKCNLVGSKSQSFALDERILLPGDEPTLEKE